jgi:hypothetical protein
MEDEPIQGKEEEECPPGIASEAEVVPAAADSEGAPAAEPGKTGPVCSKSTTDDAKATQRKRPAFKKPTAKKIDHPVVTVNAADNKKDSASGARGLLEGQRFCRIGLVRESAFQPRIALVVFCMPSRANESFAMKMPAMHRVRLPMLSTSLPMTRISLPMFKKQIQQLRQTSLRRRYPRNLLQQSQARFH